MAHVAEHLPGKCKALNSNPSIVPYTPPPTKVKCREHYYQESCWLCSFKIPKPDLLTNPAELTFKMYSTFNYFLPTQPLPLLLKSS
jgi:hypothetical protein